jgi:hypothetical protein
MIPGLCVDPNEMLRSGGRVELSPIFLLLVPTTTPNFFLSKMKMQTRSQENRKVWSRQDIVYKADNNIKKKLHKKFSHPSTTPHVRFITVTTYFEPSAPKARNVLIREPLPEVPALGDDPALLDSFDIGIDHFSGFKLAAVGITGLY